MPEIRLGYYDRQGKPFSDVLAWAKKAEGPDGYKRVAEAHVGPYWISTVWVGLDMGFSGPPLIFETLVFARGDDPLDLDGEQDRYSTEDQALAGHDQMVARVRQLLLGMPDYPVAPFGLCGEVEE